MWNKVANIILRNRFLILGIFALLSVWFAYYTITGLKIDNKYGNMLPEDTETQQTYKALRAVAVRRRRRPSVRPGRRGPAESRTNHERPRL